MYDLPSDPVDHEPFEELAVLNVDRPVERELLPSLLETLGAGALSAADDALGVSRREEEDHVRDKRDRDEEERPPTAGAGS